MFRKTVRIKLRKVDKKTGEYKNGGDIIETVCLETYWLLFLPIYTRTAILKTNR